MGVTCQVIVINEEAGGGDVAGFVGGFRDAVLGVVVGVFEPRHSLDWAVIDLDEAIARIEDVVDFRIAPRAAGQVAVGVAGVVIGLPDARSGLLSEPANAEVK